MCLQKVLKSRKRRARLRDVLLFFAALRAALAATRGRVDRSDVNAPPGAGAETASHQATQASRVEEAGGTPVVLRRL